MTPDKVLEIGYVFPLGDDYKPRIKWREGSKKGRVSFPSPAPHWGLDCGKSGIVVLDVDIKNGKDGRIALSGLPPLPSTYTVKTKSGGLHYYFRGVGRNTVGELGIGLDTRGAGGYVVIYSDVVDSSPAALLPQWLADAIAFKDTQQKKGVGELDKPLAVADAVAFAKSAAPAVVGESGDARTLRMAMELRDRGVSEQMALEILLSCWNERCDPPWDAEDLAKKVANAYRYAKNEEPGTKSREAILRESREAAESVFGGVEAAAKGSEPELWVEGGAEEEKEEESRPICVASMEYGKAPPRKWLVEGWIPLRSVCSLYGPPSAGKSLISVELGMCVSSGAEWFGNRVVNPCPVLYVSCEDDKDEIHHRVDHIRNKEVHYESIGGELAFHVWDRVGKDSMLAAMTMAGVRRKKFLDLLEKELSLIAPEGEPRALILDTLIDMGDINENDRNHVNYFLKFVIGGLAIRHNATVVVLAHPSKSSSYSGSTAMQGSVRAQLFLEWHESNPDLRWLRRGKTNRAQKDPEGSGILLQWTDGCFTQIDAEAFEKGMEASWKRCVFNMLKDAAEAQNWVKRSANAKNPLKSNPVEDENGLPIPFEKVKELINKMIDEGVVEDDPGKGLVPIEVFPSEVFPSEVFPGEGLEEILGAF